MSTVAATRCLHPAQRWLTTMNHLSMPRDARTKKNVDKKWKKTGKLHKRHPLNTPCRPNLLMHSHRIWRLLSILRVWVVTRAWRFGIREILSVTLYLPLLGRNITQRWTTKEVISKEELSILYHARSKLVVASAYCTNFLWISPVKAASYPIFKRL